MQRAFERTEVVGDDGLHVTVEAACDQATVFAFARQHVARERHGYLRIRGVEHFARPSFMCGVHVAVQEAHHEDLHTVTFHQSSGCLDKMRLVERCHDAAIGSHAFANAKRAATRRQEQRFNRIHVDLIHPRAPADADVEDIAHTIREDEAEFGARLGQDAVGADRRAVDHACHVLWRAARHLDGVQQTLHEATLELRRRRRDLVDGEIAGARIAHEDVREGAADIDTYCKHVCLSRAMRHALNIAHCNLHYKTDKVFFGGRA